MGEMVHVNGQNLEDKLRVHKTKGNYFIHSKDYLATQSLSEQIKGNRHPPQPFLWQVQGLVSLVLVVPLRQKNKTPCNLNGINRNYQLTNCLFAMPDLGGWKRLGGGRGPIALGS